MAANIDVKAESTTNPCCSAWEDRFLKLQQKVKKTEDGRAALKKAVGIYEQQFEKMQNEKLQLKKAYEEAKLQTDHERKEKEKESAARVLMENEISSLKTEILSLSKKGDLVSENTSEELTLLKQRVCDKEKEINCLQEEKKRAIVEKSKIEQEFSKLKTQLLNLETEKKKLMQDVLKERVRADSEKKRADETLKTAKTKSEDQNLETEIGRLKEVLDNERKRADCEAKKAETEKKNVHKVKEMLKVEQSRADEQRKLFDAERKKAEEFAHQLQRLKCEADEAKSKLVSECLNCKKVNKKYEAEKKKSIKEKKKAEEQQKIAEMSTKHALEEKQNAVRLQQQLQDCQNKYDKLKKDMEIYETNMKLVKQKVNVVGNGADLDVNKETEDKKVAEMFKMQVMKEKSRADKLAKQLEDTKKLTKNEPKSAEMNILKKRLKLEKERRKHYNQVADHEKKCKKTVEEELHRLKLEFARFSSRVGLCSCFDICNVGKSCLEKNDNVISERKSGKELANPKKPNIDISTPSFPISGTCTESTSGTVFKMETMDNRKKLDSLALVSSMASFSDRQLVVGPQEKLQFPVSQLSSENAEVADNNVKSTLKNKDGNTKKRKRSFNVIESVEPLYTDDKTRHVNIAKNASEKTCNDDFENFKKMFDGDCMKLLDFDSEVDEERYRAAVERPLSPTLPNIEFERNVNDVKASWSIVVFSEIRDSGTLSKIFHMTKNISGHCVVFSQSDLVVKNIISTLSADEVLSPKEKVCVFFSLFLKSLSSIALTNFNDANDGNFLSHIQAVSGQLKKVMSDVDTRTRFAKACDIEELISLVQNFLVNGETLICSNDTSFETPSLPDSKASLHELVAGAVLLASVCEAFDRVDFLCDMSYTLSRVTSSSTLTLLHVFVYVCGEKLLNHGDYSLIMTVIKSLVIFCERENVSSGFPSCAKCPFSIGAVSMEELASLLLKKVSDCSIHMSGMMTYKLLKVSDDDLSDLGDVLSLLELLATKMKWGWVCKNIVSELLKMSEACVVETPLTSIFVLLGQMARLGIDANGLQDDEVESIRVKLILFISKTTSSEISLPVQFAAVTALLGTTPLSFQEICKNSLELSPSPPVRSATDCIQRWFSLLNDERKSLSIRLLTADAS